MSNYNTRQHLIELLSDFAEYISDEVSEDKDIQTVVASYTYTEYIEDILADMELCCPLEIEKAFKELLENLENGYFDLSDFEGTIEDIISSIERVSFQNSNQYEDGIAVSDTYDFTISLSSSSAAKPVFIAPIKKEIIDNTAGTAPITEDSSRTIPNVKIVSWIKQEHLLAYLQNVTISKSIAWTSLDQTLGKQIAVAVSGSLTKSYFDNNAEFTEGFSYFANSSIIFLKQTA